MLRTQLCRDSLKTLYVSKPCIKARFENSSLDTYVVFPHARASRPFTAERR